MVNNIKSIYTLDNIYLKVMVHTLHLKRALRASGAPKQFMHFMIILIWAFVWWNDL
jgi:hypothetical protein